jgi:hypothetical protein
MSHPCFCGNLGRFVGQGGAFANFDLSLVKNTRLSESANVQFRAEFFNVLNWPNFGPPSGTNRMVFLGGGARNGTFWKSHRYRQQRPPDSIWLEGRVLTTASLRHQGPGVGS